MYTGANTSLAVACERWTRGGVSEGSVEGDESRGCDGAREIEGRRDQP